MTQDKETIIIRVYACWFCIYPECVIQKGFQERKCKMPGVLLRFAYLWAIGCCFSISVWLLLRADRNPTTRALIACQVLVIIWCVPLLFFDFAAVKTVKYLCYCVSYFGISFIGPAWLCFSFLYCRKNLGWTKWLLFFIAGFDYAMLLTNAVHHWFYREFEAEYVIYGPIFYFHMVFTYFCVLAGIGAVLKEFRQKRVETVHLVCILLTAAVPLGFNCLYLSGLSDFSFDLTPPAFSLSSLFMLLAVFRYDFLDIYVSAAEKIFASISEGVIICNRRGMITCCNEPAKRWTGVCSGELLPDSWNFFSSDKEKKKNHILCLEEGKKIQVKSYIQRNKKGKMTAGILLFTDVSEYDERLRQSRELAVAEQHLAIEQERNRIAQEVHDTTGHTLTMIQSLIKLIQISYEEGQDKTAEEYLSQAQELAASGIRQLRWSINHMRQGISCALVTQSIYQLTGSVKEIPIEVEIQGEDDPSYSHLSGIVYSCLREAITNCLKYAHASRMDVIVKFAKKELVLYLFDNGQGCPLIQENNGLKGIRKRVGQAGGEVRFLSASGEGFQLYIQLPVNIQEETQGGEE